MALSKIRQPSLERVLSLPITSSKRKETEKERSMKNSLATASTPVCLICILTPPPPTSLIFSFLRATFCLVSYFFVCPCVYLRSPFFFQCLSPAFLFSVGASIHLFRQQRRLIGFALANDLECLDWR